MADGSEHFRKYLVEGIEPDVERIKSYVERSLMLVTALSPVIGDDKASQTAHHALDQTSRSGRRKIVAPYVAADGNGHARNAQHAAKEPNH